MSCILADVQNWPEAGVPGFSNKEKARVYAHRIPGEEKQRFGVRHYPRKPREDVGRWFANHAAKLRSLERAEGM